MGAQQNGSISLEDLARRLEALERENAELRGKVAALLEGSDGRREEVEVPRGSASSVELEEGRISRRGLLGKAGAAAAGLVVAGALTQRDIREAKADIVSGSTNTSGRGAVEGTNDNLDGYGVWGKGPSFANSNSTGVLGESGYVGVKGKAPIGVQGVSDTGGVGVYGDDVSGSGGGGEGVRGTSTQGRGVLGSSAFGYGGVFSGGKAQLRLLPRSTTGKPSGDHNKGEISMDKAGTLFVCVASTTSRAAAKWKKLSAVAV